MGARWDWRWLLRRRCAAIATTEPLIEDGERVGIRILLCERRRFHRGACFHEAVV